MAITPMLPPVARAVFGSCPHCGAPARYGRWYAPFADLEAECGFGHAWPVYPTDDEWRALRAEWRNRR